MGARLLTLVNRRFARSVPSWNRHHFTWKKTESVADPTNEHLRCYRVSPFDREGRSSDHAVVSQMELMLI